MPTPGILAAHGPPCMNMPDGMRRNRVLVIPPGMRLPFTVTAAAMPA